MGVGFCPTAERGIHGFLQRPFALEKHIVRVFSPSHSPNLFNGVEIGGVRGQLDKNHLFPDVPVFRFAFVLDEPEHLLMPRSVIHYQGVLETILNGVRSNEFTNAFNCGAVVEPIRFENGQPAGARHNETAVGNLVPAGKRFNLGLAPLLEPT